MNRCLLWLSVFVTSSAILPTFGNAAEKDASPGERVFGVAKVVQFYPTMSEKHLAGLAPAGGVPFGPPGFGPPGFGPPREPSDDTHRNTFGVEFPRCQVDVTFDGQTVTGG